MAAIRDAIVAVLEEDRPRTARNVFYALVVAGLVEKTEDACKGVGRLLVEMRRSEQIPYNWIEDETRVMRRPVTFSSAEEALRRTAATYRQSLWDDAAVVPEIWIEKAGLAGLIVDITWQWDVPLMATRGYASISALHAAAQSALDRHDQLGQRTAIYYFGDHDPAGKDIDRAIVEGIGRSLLSLTGQTWWTSGLPDDQLAEAAVEAFDEYADFERVGVLSSQITALNLPTRPTKRNAHDHRAKAFVGDSVELDAMPRRMLRRLVEESIERHVDQHALGIMRVAEEEERAGILRVIDVLNGGGA